MASGSIRIKPTFVPYTPICGYKAGHPGDVVETLSLCSVPLKLPNYKHSVPEVLYRSSEPSLSAVQMDAVILAGASHTKKLETLVPSRQGFLIGDGTGVGKGRELLAIILDNWIKGREKALVLSSSPILIQDLRKDLKELLKPLKGKYHDHRPEIEVLEMPEHMQNIEAKNGIQFCTYATLSSSRRHEITLSQDGTRTFDTRLSQIISWLGGANFDGVIVFDEAHRAKGFSEENESSKVGDSVVEVQEILRKARVVYMSATIATSVRDMEFMTRLGLWGANKTAFQTFAAFFNFVDNRGVTGSEIVACEMKSRGIYVSRHLSYSGCSYQLEYSTLSTEMKSIYDKSSKIWMKIIKLCNKKLRSQMWATCQKFFKHLCIASKLPSLFKIVREGRQNNQSVVIGLQSTGAAAYDLFSKSEYHDTSDIFSPCRIYLESFLLNHFNFSINDLGLCVKRGEKASKSAVVMGGKRKVKPPPAKRRRFEPSEPRSEKEDEFDTDLEFDDNDDDENEMTEEDINNDRQLICKLFKELAPILPSNTIDMICAEFGYTNVAEMTKREAFQTLVKKEDGTYCASNQTALPKGSLETARDAFQEGFKHIAIISEAASTGISLHSSRNCNNRTQRLHVMLEAPWSAMSACQQIGRTNRSNQVIPPAYIILMSKLECERRFATSLAGRMGNLGALCKGDRNSSHGTIWSKYDINEAVAKRAIKGLLNTICEKKIEYKFFNSPEDEIKRKRYCQVLKNVRALHYLKTKQLSPHSAVLSHAKFLNRVLCMEVNMQREILELLDIAIEKVKRKQEVPLSAEIKDLVDEISGDFKQIDETTFDLGSGVSCKLSRYQIDDILTWEDLENLLKTKKYAQSEYRFYAKQLPSTHYKVCVGINLIKGKKVNLLLVYRPSTKELTEKPWQHLKSKGYKPIDTAKAKLLWKNEEKYFRLGKCSGYLRNFCDERCNHHKEPYRKFGVVTGGILSVWSAIESVTDNSSKFVRHYEENKQFVGMLIHHKDLENTTRVLGKLLSVLE